MAVFEFADDALALATSMTERSCCFSRFGVVYHKKVFATVLLFAVATALLSKSTRFSVLSSVLYTETTSSALHEQ